MTAYFLHLGKGALGIASNALNGSSVFRTGRVSLTMPHRGGFAPHERRITGSADQFLS